MTRRYESRFRSYRDFDHFLSRPPRSGLHSFRNQGDLVEVLFEPGEVEPDIALVTFPAAANDKTSFPKFDAQRTAKSLGITFLAFSDPAIAYTLDVKTNWCLGSGGHDMSATISRIVEHLVGKKQIIFFGASAGGFSALRIGNYFKESLSFVINPRTNLLLHPIYLDRIHDQVYPGLTYKEIDEVKGLSLPRSQNHVLFSQNLRDDVFFNNQTAGYLAKNEGYNKLVLRWGNWGQGHVAMPNEERHNVFNSLISGIKNSNVNNVLLELGNPALTLGSVQAERRDILGAISI